jgi:hypothetical protein
MPLSTELDTLTQRTSGASGSLNTAAQRQQFIRSIRSDLSDLMGQHNDVTKPIFDHLVDTQALNGLDARAMYSNWEATSASGDLYWSSTHSRANTLSESLNVLKTDITALENAVEDLNASTFDGTNIFTFVGMSGIADNSPGYSAHGAIATVSDGDSLEVAIQKLDLAIAGVGVPAAVQSFTGMSSASDAAPTYSTHGAISTVLDNDSLELAIQKLDAGIAGISSDFTTTSNVTFNTAYLTDDFVIGSDQLNDDSGAGGNKDRRFFFEKSTGAFRGGMATGTEFDSANRGTVSFAYGRNCIAGDTYTCVVGGNSNEIDGTNVSNSAAVIGGVLNTIGDLGDSANAVIIGGTNGLVNSDNAAMIGGSSGVIGYTGSFGADNSAVIAGDNPTLSGSINSSVIGGHDNIVGSSMKDATNVAAQGENMTVLGGDTNRTLFQNHYGVTHGTFADSGTYNAYTHSAGTFDGSTRGDAQYERAMFIGTTGLSSTISHLYLNSSLAGTTQSALNPNGYCLNIQAESTALVEFSMVSRRNNAGTPENCYATGEILVSRDGSGVVTVIHSNITYGTNADTTTWTSGGGNIAFQNDPSYAWSLLPVISTGTGATMQEARATVTCKVTVVGLATP